VPPGQTITYEATESSLVGIATFERSRTNGATWETLETSTDASMVGDTLRNDTGSDEWFRFRVRQNGESAVSGSLAVVAYATPRGVVNDVVSATHHSKVGATAGWVTGGATNVALVTLPASQTGSTLVVPCPHIDEGDVLTGFHLVGQIESAGGAVTLDVEMRKQTAAAADVVDASITSMTQLAVTADTTISKSNARKAGLALVAKTGESYYLLITGTTAVSTDIALMSAVFEVARARG
jgi:hypothetical protein